MRRGSGGVSNVDDWPSSPHMLLAVGYLVFSLKASSLILCAVLYVYCATRTCEMMRNQIYEAIDSQMAESNRPGQIFFFGFANYRTCSDDTLQHSGITMILAECL